MLWLNKDGYLIAKDGYLIDCDKCPCDLAGYVVSLMLDGSETPDSGSLVVKTKDGCGDGSCLYDYSQYYCVSQISGDDSLCAPDDPPCPCYWHVQQYPYYDDTPPQWIIDAGWTWKIENNTLYVWVRKLKHGFATTTIVFSLPEGCEFVGGRVCCLNWPSPAGLASLAIDGNHATLTYLNFVLDNSYAQAVYYSVTLLATCNDLTIDSFSISGLNDDCWEPDPVKMMSEHTKIIQTSDLNAIMENWASNPDPRCYVAGEEDEFE